MAAKPGSISADLGVKKMSYDANLGAKKMSSQADWGDFSGPSQVYFKARKAPTQVGSEGTSGSHRTHLEARKVTFSGAHQAYLEVREKTSRAVTSGPFQAHLEARKMTFLRPSQAHLGTRKGSSRGQLEVRKKTSHAGLMAFPRPPQAQAESRKVPSWAGLGAFSGSSQAHLETKKERSQTGLMAYPRTVQVHAEVKKASSPPSWEAFMKPSQEQLDPRNGQSQVRSMSLHANLESKVEVPPSEIYRIKKFFRRKMDKETMLGPLKKDQQQLQSLKEEIQTENQSPKGLQRIGAELLSPEQGSSSSEAQQVRHEEERCPFSYYPYFVNKGTIIMNMLSTETGLIKKGQSLYVCDQFLMNNCQRGRNCPAYHTLLPFHWQFLHKEDNAWHSIPLGSQLHLEMLFTNPSRSTVIISYEPGRKVFFQMITKFFPKIAPFITARRITCQENSLFPPTFVFYWSEDEEKWICYSEKVQHLIQTSNQRILKLISKSENMEVILDLDNLVQTKNKSIQSMTYRPEYIPLYQLVTKLRIWHVEQSNDKFLCGEEPADLYIGPYPAQNIVFQMKGKENFTLMEMFPSEIAYQNCCKHFYSSIDHQDAVVLRVFRLYNPVLWEQYRRQKNKMLQSINRTDFSPLEYHLFHQTNLTMEEVAVNGLEPKLTRFPGSLGYATYFTLDAQTTCRMNLEQASEFGHVMVLAKVLVGEKTYGKPGLLRPPLNIYGRQGDCCVNDLCRPTLFAMFEKKYSYPYFIILYKFSRDTIHLAF